MQVDETTDVSTKEQLSVIIRLDKKDDIVERFLKFYNVSSDRTAPAISSIVKDVYSHYVDSIRNRLIMQTYDGAHFTFQDTFLVSRQDTFLVSKPLLGKIIPWLTSFTVQLTA